MTTSIVLLTLTLQLGPGSGLPDLCAQEPLLDPTGQIITDAQGTALSRYCEWAGPDAPLWDDLACCSFDASGAACVSLGERDSCDAGSASYYCERGVELADGGLVCQQSFPSACEYSTCTEPGLELDAQDDVQEEVICCVCGICYPWDGQSSLDCEGTFTWCDDGYSTIEGTVECFD